MSNRPSTTIAGIPAARGFASGPVFIYRGGDLPIPEYVVEAGREDDECQRLRRAIAETKRDLEGLISALRERTGREDVRIFECHLMILDDGMLQDEAFRRISEERLNAEAAVRKTADGAREQFQRMNDPYFRERVRDLDDIERRVLKSLMGFDRNPARELREPSIIVADDLTPSETIQLPREFVLGFATNGGSATSHVALLSRALAIPAVCGLVNITSRVEPGETVLLDGTNGAVTLHPDREAESQFAVLLERQKSLAVSAATGRPAGTMKDGSSVMICANVHPGVPVAGAREYGARGIGLYRSEYLWLNREKEPSEAEQYEAYASAAKFAGRLEDGASATIRLLDIGGDKLVRGISAKEPNPFLGNRSIRYLLSHRQVLRTQLRAVLRASAAGRLRIMYPMVSCIEELRELARELEAAKMDLESQGLEFDRKVPVGAMIEVPSAALNADEFARFVSFFSIGTNDLVQYTMAADRGNESVAHLYQPLNPAVVKLVKMTVSAAEKAGIPVSVCGESAADPVAAAYWVALGASELSVSATYIPVLSRVFSHLTRVDLAEYAKVPASIPPDSTGAEIYSACREWLLSKLDEDDRGLLE